VPGHCVVAASIACVPTAPSGGRHHPTGSRAWLVCATDRGEATERSCSHSGHFILLTCSNVMGFLIYYLNISYPKKKHQGF